MGFRCDIGKIVVFTFNLILFLVGLAVMIFGIIALANPQAILNAFDMIPGFTSFQYIVNMDEAISNNGILLTVVGAVIALICLIGMVGTCLHNKIFIGTYIGLVFLVLLFEIAVIIYAAVDYTAIQTRIQSLMFTSLVENFSPVQINGVVITNSSSPGGVAWETLQFQYACCGAYGYTDFAKFSWDNVVGTTPLYTSNATVPPSCCMQTVQYQSASLVSDFVNMTYCLNSPPLYTNSQGCYVPVMQRLSEHAYVTTIIIASLVAIETVVLMLSMHQIAKENKDKIGHEDYM